MSDKKYEVNDKRRGFGDEPDPEPPVKFRISPLVAPHAPEDQLIQEPGTTPMDDTSQIAFSGPRFRKEERSVTVLSADNDVVKWYKQKFVGARCKCVEKEEKDKSIIETAYCPVCFYTGIEGGYDYYKRVRLVNPYIEWGGIQPPMPSGRLETSLDFEYHVTPGDFFELGKVVADIGFNVDAGVSERHDNEGKPCLWRIIDVTVVRDETGFALGWNATCQNVEPYEPIYGWFEKNAGVEDG
jgi:hypothetical protein